MLFNKANYQKEELKYFSDEPCWNLNQSDTEMSLRDIEKIVGIRQLWDNLCNCGCILEDIGKEWFLPTYIGLITSDK